MSDNDQIKNCIGLLLKAALIKKKYINVLLSPKSLSYLSTAFTDISDNNENNLAFLHSLGSVTMNQTFVSYLVETYPTYTSAQITNMKKNFFKDYPINKIAEYAMTIGVDKLIIYNSLKIKVLTTKIIQNVFEATFAAIEIVLDHKYKRGMGFIVCYRLLSMILDDEDINISYEKIVDARTRLKETFDLYKNKKIRFETRCKYLNNQYCTSYLYESTVNGKDLDGKDTYGPFIQVGDHTFNGKAFTKAEAEENLAIKALAYYKSLGFVKRIPNEYLKFCI